MKRSFLQTREGNGVSQWPAVMGVPRTQVEPSVDHVANTAEHLLSLAKPKNLGAW